MNECGNNKFVKSMDDAFNTSVTENGAFGYKTTYDKLVDLNFFVPQLRGMDANEVGKMFVEAFEDNNELAIRWLFYLGDIRGGLGERASFKNILKYLALKNPGLAKKFIRLVPEYSRWDCLFVFFDTPIERDMVVFVYNQIQMDLDLANKGCSISLLVKWMPSINTSSKSSRKLAYRFIREFNGIFKAHITPRKYRLCMSKLRRHLDVVETKISANKWGEVDYSKVPSKANLKYCNAFGRHDFDRRMAFLRDVENGKRKINASVLFPHDIVQRFNYIDDCDASDSANIRTLESLWKNLPNVLGRDTNDSILVVQDGSGSMYSAIPNSNANAIAVSIGLSIYAAEQLKGAFHNRILTFGADPQWIELSDSMSLGDKIRKVQENDDFSNTNIEKVFDVVLNAAIKSNCSQSELPSTILIVSDMEFDEACNDWCGDTSLFKYIGEKFVNAGYKMPKLVFWNVNSRTSVIPLKENEKGLALVSGFSTNILKMVMSKKMNPGEILKETLMNSRYDMPAICL